MDRRQIQNVLKTRDGIKYVPDAPRKFEHYLIDRVAKGRSTRVGLGQKVDPKNQPDFWPFFDLFRPFKNEEIPTKGAQNSSYSIKSFRIFYLLSLMSILCIIFLPFLENQQWF